MSNNKIVLKAKMVITLRAQRLALDAQSKEIKAKEKALQLELAEVMTGEDIQNVKFDIEDPKGNKVPMLVYRSTQTSVSIENRELFEAWLDGAGIDPGVFRMDSVQKLKSFYVEKRDEGKGLPDGLKSFEVQVALTRKG